MLWKSEQKKIAELESSLETANSRISELEAENADYKETIAGFHLSTQKYDKKEEAMKKQHDEAVKKLKLQMAETEKSVNKRVNQALQSMGVSQFLVEIPVEVKSAKTVYQQFLAMPVGSAKQESYQKNEKLIREGMTQTNQS